MKSKIIYIPIALIEFYLSFTLILFAFGPFKYPVLNPFKFYILLALYQIALFVGYYIAIKKNKQKKIIFNSNHLFLKITKVLLIINILFIFFLMVRDFGLSEFSIEDIFSRIKLGFSSPGLVYNLKFDITSENIYLGQFGSILVLLVQPISYLVIPAGLMFFSKLNVIQKIFLFINLILELCHGIGLGTTKGVFDVFIMIFISICLYVFKIMYIKKISKKQVLYMLTSSIIIIGLIFSFFNKNIGDRGIGETVQKNEIHSVGLNTVPYDTDCLLYNFIPKSMQNMTTLVISYLSQGYYGFELSLGQNPIPMYGVGNSMFLQKYIAKYVFDISQLSLQYRIIPNNWDPYINWHSLYSWYANDFGFLGVIIVMLFIGYLVGVFLMESMNDNIFAKLLFILTVIMVLFIPMNSQIFSFTTTFCSFAILSGCYLIFRK